MAFGNLRNTAAIKTAKGSPIGVYAEVTATTPTFTNGTTYTLPYIMDSNRNIERATESVEGEGGANFQISGTTTRTLNITFGQQDSKTKKFLEEDLANKTITIVKQEHDVVIDSEYQFAIYPQVVTGGSFTRNAKSIETEMAFDITNNTNAITLDLTDFITTANGFAVTSTCATFTIPANAGYAIYTQASS